jgi:putative hydrolase of the HAD superfamily
MTDMKTVVAFDIGGVLGSNWSVPYLRQLIEKKYSPALWKPIREVYDEIWVPFSTGTSIAEREFWRRIIDASGIEESVDECIDGVRTQIHPFTETLALAASLKKNGYGIAILSNNVKEWFEYFDTHTGIYDIFEKDIVLLSYEIHALKPRDSAYTILNETCRRKYGVCTIVFIDDRRVNVDAAERNGMTGILYDAEIKPVSALTDALKRTGISLPVEFRTGGKPDTPVG